MITGVSHMKRKLAALLLAMLILFSFPAVQAESPDGEGSMTITLLDRRVVTQRYGKAILNALPPFRREIA